MKEDWRVLTRTTDYVYRNSNITRTKVLIVNNQINLAVQVKQDNTTDAQLPTICPLPHQLTHQINTIYTMETTTLQSYELYSTPPNNLRFINNILRFFVNKTLQILKRHHKHNK